jgi:transcriptional regulator with XRE-family HTH domain
MMETEAGAGRTLKQARMAQMFTVRGLAAAAGCSPHTVHEVEQGKRLPRFDTIRRLSAALGIEPTEIAEFRRVLLLEEERR